MKKHIPNFVTTLNLVCGVIGIWFALEYNPFYGALLIFLAGIFDFMDGFLARQLKAYSDIGKSLDSLADIISFGVLPGFLVFRLQTISIGLGSGYGWIQDLNAIEALFLLVPILIPALSAIRLAKFDNDSRQTDEFRGLPTPANAFFIAALVYSYPSLHETMSWLYLPWVIFVLTSILSLLLVSDIPMFSLKFKSFGFKENSLRYIFLGVSLLAVLLLWIPGILLIISLYIGISVYISLSRKQSPA
ncbi:MAG: CDP-alcohol phosphatidyltransferase family protein [Bacteroidales bacterium]|nr:CDP-alcohol phosphatidyltransferase family protein [Bacteroidales bacterium]